MKSEPAIDKIAISASARPNGFHEHVWPGIDEAVTPFPGADVLAAGIARDLDPALTIVGPTPPNTNIGGGGICVTPESGGLLTVRIDTRGTGHMWPSGAAHDRRAWLEVIAYDTNDRVVFSSGVVPDDKDPEDVGDPTLVALWDRAIQKDGRPAHQFWEVATVQSNLLRPPVTLDPSSPAFDHSLTARFAIGSLSAEVDHISARVRIRPYSRAVLDQLVASGDLDPSLARTPKTHDVAGSSRHWTRAAATAVAPVTGCVADPYQ